MYMCVEWANEEPQNSLNWISLIRSMINTREDAPFFVESMDVSTNWLFWRFESYVQIFELFFCNNHCWCLKGMRSVVSDTGLVTSCVLLWRGCVCLLRHGSLTDWFSITSVLRLHAGGGNLAWHGSWHLSRHCSRHAWDSSWNTAGWHHSLGHHSLFVPWRFLVYEPHASGPEENIREAEDLWRSKRIEMS